MEERKIRRLGTLEELARSMNKTRHIFDNCKKIEALHELYEIDGIRLIVEDGRITGWYAPDPESIAELNPEKHIWEIEPKWEIETLEDTVPYMLSSDHKMRLIGEYYQTAIRLEKLQTYWIAMYAARDLLPGSKENAEANLMNDQLTQMRTYLQTLETRARQIGADIYTHRKHSGRNGNETEVTE